MLRGHVDRQVLLTFGLASAGGGLIGALLHSRLGSPALPIVIMIVGVAGGTIAGTRLLSHVPPRRFRPIVATVLTVLGMVVVLQAIR